MYSSAFAAGYDSCEYPYEYGEGYGEEEGYGGDDCYGEEEHYAGICGGPEAPRCWNGSNCPFLASGRCQYYHPSEDAKQEPAGLGPTTPVATAAAARLSSRPWNVLVVAAPTPVDKQGLQPQAAPEAKMEEVGAPKLLRARLRSRSRSPRCAVKAEVCSPVQGKDGICEKQVPEAGFPSMAAMRGA